MSTIEVVTMIDAIGVDAGNIPTQTEKVGAYITGSGIVPWNDTQLARFGKKVVTINQLPANPGDTDAMVCDSETGAATIADAVGWGQRRMNAKHRPAFYIQASNLSSLINALVHGGVTTADIWIANWNLTMAEAAKLVQDATGPFPIVAVQFASPSSNPNTIVPGTSKTLKEANVDLSMANVNWPMRPVVTDIVSGWVDLPGIEDAKVFYSHDLGTLGYHAKGGDWKRVQLPRGV
jgi:hypothetical protein